MRRFATAPLLMFVVLLLALVGVGALLATRTPMPAAIAEKLAGAKSSNAVQGRTFDKTFGSLAALVPQTGASVAPSSEDEGDDNDDAAPATTPVSHSSQYRDLGWLKAQNPDAVTLQVLGARNEDAVKQFISGQKDPTMFAYFQVQQEGQPWFVVVYGAYATREQALGVADDIDLGLGSKPFPKRFGAYVADATAPVPQPLPPTASGVTETPAPADAPPPPPPASAPAAPGPAQGQP